MVTSQYLYGNELFLTPMTHVVLAWHQLEGWQCVSRLFWLSRLDLMLVRIIVDI